MMPPPQGMMPPPQGMMPPPSAPQAMMPPAQGMMPPQQGMQPPPQGVQGAQGIVQMGDTPMMHTCNKCGHTGQTNVVHAPTTCTYLVSAVLFCCICWPCTCVPCCCEATQGAMHTCPNCGNVVGK